jgi:hypothetical protein
MLREIGNGKYQVQPYYLAAYTVYITTNITQISNYHTNITRTLLQLGWRLNAVAVLRRTYSSRLVRPQGNLRVQPVTSTHSQTQTAGLIMITLEYTVNTIEHCYHEFESIGVSLIMNVNLLSPALSRI